MTVTAVGASLTSVSTPVAVTVTSSLNNGLVCWVVWVNPGAAHSRATRETGVNRRTDRNIETSRFKIQNGRSPDSRIIRNRSPSQPSNPLDQSNQWLVRPATPASPRAARTRSQWRGPRRIRTGFPRAPNGDRSVPVTLRLPTREVNAFLALMLTLDIGCWIRTIPDFVRWIWVNPGDLWISLRWMKTKN